MIQLSDKATKSGNTGSSASHHQKLDVDPSLLQASGYDLSLFFRGGNGVTLVRSAGGGFAGLEITALGGSARIPGRRPAAGAESVIVEIAINCQQNNRTSWCKPSPILGLIIGSI